jgi:hypothetical protein
MPIIEGLKAAAEALRQADKIPQFRAVLDAQAQIAELQVHNHEQQLEIRCLREELEHVQADQPSAEGSKIWVDLLWIPADDDPTACIAGTKGNGCSMSTRLSRQAGLSVAVMNAKAKHSGHHRSHIGSGNKIENHPRRANGCADKPSRGRGMSTSM